MDLEFNEQVLASQLSRGKCSIITEKTINTNLLKQFKENVVELVYIVEKNNDPKFIKDIINLGFNVILMSELSPEKLEPIKIDYMDFGVIQQVPFPDKEDVKELKSKNLDNLYYKSKRILISNGKSYKGEAAWKTDQQADPNQNTPLKIIDTQEFWDAIEEVYILEKNS